MTKPDPFNVTLKMEIERQKKIENIIENLENEQVMKEVERKFWRLEKINN